MRRLSPITFLTATLGLLAIVAVRGAWQSRYTASTTAGVLTLTQDSPPATVAPGGVLTYTVTTSNTGTATVTRIVTSPIVPTGLTYLPAQSNPHCSLYSGVVYCRSDDNATGFTLAPGQSKSFIVSYSVPASQPCSSTITHSVATQSLQTSPPPAKWSTVTTTVVCGASSSSPASSAPASSAQSSSVSSGIAELVLSQDAPLETVQRGGTITYILTARNIGSVDATQIVVSSYPMDVTFLPGQSDSACIEIVSEGYVSCGIDALGDGFTLRPGESRSFRLSYALPPSLCTVVTFYAALTSSPPDLNLIDNSVEAATPINCASSSRSRSRSSSARSSAASAGAGELIVSQSNLPQSAAPGGTATYTMTTENIGTATVTKIVMSSFVPTGLTYLPAQSDPHCALVSGSTTVACRSDDNVTGFTLAPGESKSFQVSYSVPESQPCPSSIRHEVAVNSLQTSPPWDQNAGNNSIWVNTTVVCGSSRSSSQVSSRSSSTSAPSVVIQSISGPTKIINCHTQSVGYPQWAINASDAAGGELTYAFIWGSGYYNEGRASTSTIESEIAKGNSNYYIKQSTLSSGIAYCPPDPFPPYTHKFYNARFYARNTQGKVASKSMTIEDSNDLTAYACLDSDGWNFFLNGTTRTLAYHGQEEETRKDECLDDRTLIEYTCDGDVIVPVTHTCLRRCGGKWEDTNRSCEEGVKVENMPAGELRPGNTYTIRWSYEGFHLMPDHRVTVNLLKGPRRWLLANSMPVLNGSYEWTIPAGLPAGDNYRIFIYDNYSGQSVTDFFSIRTDKYIWPVITNDTGGGFKPDDTINVSWSSAGFASGTKVNIVLLGIYGASYGGHGGEFYNIANNVPVTQGSYSFTLPGIAVKDVYKQYRIWIGEYPVRGWEQVGVPPIMKGDWEQYGNPVIGAPEGPEQPNCTGCPPIDACRDTWGEAYFKISAPACTDSNWTYSPLSPPMCPASGQQTRTWTKSGFCEGGVSYPAIETTTCDYQEPYVLTWNPIADTKFGGYPILSVTYGNGRFVAVGWDGMGIYSADGITWTAIGDMKFGTGNILSVTYGNGKFVAVGERGKGAYSANGITWTAIGNMKFGDADIQSVTYGNGKFVAVGYKDNGSSYFNYNHYRYEGGSYTGKGAYSANGITWTAIKGGHSVDGITWTATENMIDAAIQSVTYGNGKFVAVGWGGMGSIHSSDGITWSVIGNMQFGGYPILSITYGNDRFVAVGYTQDWNGKGAYSLDGITGTAIGNMKIGNPILSVTYGNDKFVAVGEHGKGAYSLDGIWWTAVGDMKFGDVDIRSVTYGNGRFVAVGNSGQGAYSDPNPPSLCGANWSCGAWNLCINGTMTRTCRDVNVCGTTVDKPAESQPCTCAHYGGDTYYTKGYVVDSTPATLFFSDTPQTKTDYCSQISGGIAAGTTTCPHYELGKQFCLPSGQPGQKCYSCPNGCSNGKCIGPCNSSWSCDSWSVCVNGQQTRSCRDVNTCAPDKVDVQSCTASPVAVCGNGTLEGSEQCDDGNVTSGDGCSSTCAVEVGWTCTCTTASTPSHWFSFRSFFASIFSFFTGQPSNPIQVASGCRSVCTRQQSSSSPRSSAQSSAASAGAGELVLSQNIPPATVAPGSTLTYTITTRNTGTATATRIVVSTFVPTGLTYLPGQSNPHCSLYSGVVYCRSDDNQTGFTLAPGQSKSFQVSYSVPASQACSSSIAHAAVVQSLQTSPPPDLDTSNNYTSVTTTVGCRTASSSSSPSSFRSSSSSSSSPRSSSSSAISSSSASSSPSSSAPSSRSSSLSSSRSSSAASSATSRPAGADLVISQDAPPATVAGATLQYTVTVRNDGSADATRVIVGALVPTGLTFQPALSGPDCFLSGSIVYCWNVASRTGFTLHPGESRSFGLKYAVPSSQSCHSSIIHTVITQGSPADQNTSNNYSRATTGVEC